MTFDVEHTNKKVITLCSSWVRETLATDIGVFAKVC